MKRVGEIDVHVAGRVERKRAGEQQAILYLTREAAAGAGAPVCLPPRGAPPSSASVPAGARLLKGCHGNTPRPRSEINNLSASSEQANL